MAGHAVLLNECASAGDRWSCGRARSGPKGGEGDKQSDDQLRRRPVAIREWPFARQSASRHPISIDEVCRSGDQAGLTLFFDRVTSKPVWPIEGRWLPKPGRYDLGMVADECQPTLFGVRRSHRTAFAKVVADGARRDREVAGPGGRDRARQTSAGRLRTDATRESIPWKCLA